LVHGKGTEAWILVVFLTEVFQRRAFRQAQNGFETTFTARQGTEAWILVMFLTEVFQRAFRQAQNGFETTFTARQTVGLIHENAETLGNRFIPPTEAFKTLSAGENRLKDVCSPPDCWVD
jgi:hypothetical protein